MPSVWAWILEFGARQLYPAIRPCDLGSGPRHGSSHHVRPCKAKAGATSSPQSDHTGTVSCLAASNWAFKLASVGVLKVPAYAHASAQGHKPSYKLELPETSCRCSCKSEGLLARRFGSLEDLKDWKDCLQQACWPAAASKSFLMSLYLPSGTPNACSTVEGFWNLFGPRWASSNQLGESLKRGNLSSFGQITGKPRSRHDITRARHPAPQLSRRGTLRAFWKPFCCLACVLVARTCSQSVLLPGGSLSVNACLLLHVLVDSLCLGRGTAMRSSSRLMSRCQPNRPFCLRRPKKKVSNATTNGQRTQNRILIFGVGPSVSF